MKKLLLALLSLTLIGCSDATMLISENEDPIETIETDVKEDETNVLVAYYSATEHTKAVAEVIANELDADVFVITPEDEYTSDDLNYNDDNSRVVQEHNDTSLQDIALLQTTPDNWDNYDVIFIGYPIWWGNASWVVNHFVSDNDFTNKTVIPFCTSVSSGLGSSVDNLKALTNTGEWNEGIRFSSSVSEDEVIDWITSLNLQ